MKLFNILCTASLLFSSFLLHLKYKKEQKQRGKEWVSKSNNTREEKKYTLSNNTLQFSSYSFIWQPLFHIFSSFLYSTLCYCCCCWCCWWFVRLLFTHFYIVVLCYGCFARMLWVCVDEQSDTNTQRHIFNFVDGLVNFTYTSKSIQINTRIHQCACAIQAVSIRTQIHTSQSGHINW